MQAAGGDVPVIGTILEQVQVYHGVTSSSLTTENDNRSSTRI